MEEAPIKTIGKYSYFTNKRLGEGSFGAVFKGFENTTREEVAIKKVDFKTIEKDFYLEKAVHEEIKILAKFNHPNIVRLYEVLNSRRSLYIIMDFCKDGDLKNYLKLKKCLTDQEAFAIMKQVLTGYKELAKENTIHRDLKPANILLHNGLFKICDFGFSKVINDPSTPLHTCVGSPVYMPPQILEKMDYSAKCDIWSLGIIYYQMLHGQVPWNARSEKQLLINIKNNPLKITKGSHQTGEMIRGMLQIHERKRSSLRDIEDYFGILQQLPSDVKWNGSENPSSVKEQISIQPQRSKAEEPPPAKSVAIKTKVINQSYFEELAWRHYVCIEIRLRLKQLKSFNLKLNIFQRYLILLSSSILCNTGRRMGEIMKIHQKDVLNAVRDQLEVYKQFRRDFIQDLASNFATCQISKEFDLVDIFKENYSAEVIKRAERDLNSKSQEILKRLQEELKNSPSDWEERETLLFVTELVLDMILLNEKQAKSGICELENVLQERNTRLIEKRILSKINSLRDVKVTQFF